MTELVCKFLISKTITSHPTYKHSSKEDFVNQSAPTVSGGFLKCHLKFHFLIGRDSRLESAIKSENSSTVKGSSTAEIARQPDSTTSSSSGGNNSGGDVTVKTPADEKTPASSSSQSPAQSSTGSGSSTTPSSDVTSQTGVTAKPTPTSSTRGKFGETYP